MKANVIVFDFSILVLAAAAFLGLRRALGRRKANSFLLGSVLFSLSIYTASVLLGVQNFYWYAATDYFSHYPLGGYTVWLGIVPLAACLLWFTVTAASYLASDAFTEGKSTPARAAASGLLAVVFYLLIEPVAVTNHWWTWNIKSFYLIDVPLLAWLAVFISVSVFTLMFRVTISDRSDPALIKGIENRVLKPLFFKGRESTASISRGRLRGVFLFRLAIGFAVFWAAAAPFAVALWALANRGHIPPGW